MMIKLYYYQMVAIHFLLWNKKQNENKMEIPKQIFKENVAFIKTIHFQGNIEISAI